MNNNIKIGSYLPNIGKVEQRVRLETLKQAGFDFICVGAKDLIGDDKVTPTIAEKYGFVIENVHLSGRGTNYMWMDDCRGDEITENYCNEIEKFASIGIKTGVAHVTWGINSTPPVSEIGLTRFTKLARCAEKNHFKLALENSVSAPHLRAVLDLIHSEYVGYCFDSGHWNCFCPQEDFLGDYGDRLFAMHLQDNEGNSDLHMIPMDGCIDWEKVIGQLKKTKLFQTNITFETARIVRRECVGMNVLDIHNSLEKISIINDQELVSIYDGGFEIYVKLTTEEYYARLYNVGKRFSNLST